jgi:hypothetical protein
MEKLIIKEQHYVKEIKERLSRPGRMQFFMILRNDSYRGFDKKISVCIDVLKDVKRAPVEYDEEDIQAQKAPSMMQSMMELNPGDNSDDDESEDEGSQTTQASQPAHNHGGGCCAHETEAKKDK